MIWAQQQTVRSCSFYFHRQRWREGGRADGRLPFWLWELDAGEDVVGFAGGG